MHVSSLDPTKKAIKKIPCCFWKRGNWSAATSKGTDSVYLRLISWSAQRSGLQSLRPVLFSQRPNTKEVMWSGEGREVGWVGIVSLNLYKNMKTITTVQHVSDSCYSHITWKTLENGYGRPRLGAPNEQPCSADTKGYPTTGLPGTNKRRRGPRFSHLHQLFTKKVGHKILCFRPREDKKLLHCQGNNQQN